MDRFRKARALAVLASLLPLAATAGTFAPTPSPPPTPSAAPSATAKPTPPPGSDAAVKARAREWIGRFQTGDIDRSQLTPAFSQALDSTAVGEIKSVLPKGPPLSIQLASTSSDSEQNYYIYIVTWKEGSLSFSFGLTPGGKIGTAFFRAT